MMKNERFLDQLDRHYICRLMVADREIDLT